MFPSKSKITTKAYHLFCSHTHCLYCEFAPAHVKEILEVRPQKVDNKNIVESLLTEIVHLRHTSYGFPANNKTMKAGGKDHILVPFMVR